MRRRATDRSVIRRFVCRRPISGMVMTVILTVIGHPYLLGFYTDLDSLILFIEKIYNI